MSMLNPTTSNDRIKEASDYYDNAGSQIPFDIASVASSAQEVSQNIGASNQKESEPPLSAQTVQEDAQISKNAVRRRNRKKKQATHEEAMN